MQVRPRNADNGRPNLGWRKGAGPSPMTVPGTITGPPTQCLVTLERVLTLCYMDRWCVLSLYGTGAWGRRMSKRLAVGPARSHVPLATHVTNP